MQGVANANLLIAKLKDRSVGEISDLTNWCQLSPFQSGIRRSLSNHRRICSIDKSLSYFLIGSSKCRFVVFQ